MSLRQKLAFGAVCSLLLTGCSKSPDEQMKTSAQSALSTTATAHLLFSTWAKRQVPTPYTRSTLRTLRGDLDDETAELKKTQAPQQAQVLASLSRVTSALLKVEPLLQQNNRVAAQPVVATLAHEEATLRELVERLNKESR